MDIPGVLWLCLDWNACCIWLWNLHTNSWLMWWDLFSPSLAYGRGTNRCFWCFLESCMMPSCLDKFRWRLRTFSWRTTFLENFFFGRWRWEWCFWKSFGICFASHDVFARQQQLPNCTLFQTVFAWWCFWRRFWREAFIFWTGVFFRTLERCICNICKCMWMWMSLFSFIYFTCNLQQTLENNVHVCTYLVQACCTTE